MNQTRRQILSPEALSRISNLKLVARLVVEGFLAGLHRSPYHGFSVEFAEHRPYEPGDPLKQIDWKVLARTDRFYVKQFEEETNLRSYICVDASSSMGFASGNVAKLEYASRCAAALAFLLLRQRDAVGLTTHDVSIRRMIPPRSRPSHLDPILRELQSIEPSGETACGAVFDELAERLSRRGLVVVLSDLMDDPDRVISGLRHFRHRGHEVIVFWILDPAERDLPYEQETRFVDAETANELVSSPWRIRAAYQRALTELQAKYVRSCREARIDIVPLTTEEPFDLTLSSYLKKRARLS
jgi:uncharacterized protein (DUF58 family)